MSEQTGQQEHPDQPDDSEPSPVRQKELREAYEKNVAAGRAPYEGVRIRTRGELFWIMKERDWHGEYEAHGQMRADFSAASFREANLSGIRLNQANLRRTTFRDANLRGAHLEQAYLTGARFNYADLTGAFLDESDLSDARFFQTNLSASNFDGARMNSVTIFAEVILSQETCFGDVVWDGVSLVKVNWGQVPRLGDELPIKKAKSRKDRIRALRSATRAYLGLAVALRAQGLLIPASGYRLRQQVLERRALRLERKYGGWFFSGLLDLVAGYGERSVRALWSYVVVVLSFAEAYYAITNFAGFAFLPTHSSPLIWYEALVLSISSFHGRGFFPSMLSLGDPVAIVAAAEAIIGLFIELIFIATFSRRFLGN